MAQHYPIVNIQSDTSGFPRAVGLSFSDTPQDFSSTEHLKVPRYPWQLVDGLGWPMDLDGEEEFRLDLTVAAKGKPSSDWERSDVSVLMGALRVSATFESLSELLPGISPARLLGAYSYLEAGLQHALLGFEALRSDVSDDSLEEHGSAAAMIISATVSRLRSTAEPSRITSAQRTFEAVAEVRESVDTIYTALETIPAGSLEGVELGRLLFSAGEECLFAHPLFVPLRVGELSPVAIDLLTHSRTED